METTFKGDFVSRNDKIVYAMQIIGFNIIFCG